MPALDGDPHEPGGAGRLVFEEKPLHRSGYTLRDMTTTPAARRIGRLALEDGSVFVGEGFGASGLVTTGEVVFNTAMGGYQESLTDPSYTGQILVQTAPLIGNTGVNGEDVESSGVAIAGLVVRELAKRHSNYRATGTLEDYLADAGVLGVTGVDTARLPSESERPGLFGV